MMARRALSPVLFSASESVRTSTAVASIVGEYLQHIRLVKTAWSARVDTWYLRNAFGLDGSSSPHLEVAHLEDLTTAHVSRFLDAVVEARNLSAKTGNRYREILHRLVSWSMGQRGVVMPFNLNPVSWVERLRERRPGKRFLTLPEVAAQLDVLTPWPEFRAMVATLIYAGLRRSELLWLTPSDVDLAAGLHGMLRIRAKTVQGVSWEPKTGQERGVPISSSLRPFLASVSPGRTWFFPSPAGKRWDPDGFSRRLRDLNRGAGLVWSCLDYRHTFGSQLAMKGESLYKISALMGNSPEICRRHYAALLPESLFEAVEFPSVGAVGAETEKDLQCLQVL